MKIISARTRVTIGLISLGFSVWLIAFTLGMFPDRQGAVIDGRAALCENVALHCSLLASRNDQRTMESALEGLVSRNGDVQSVAIRRPDGSILVSVGPHARLWSLLPGDKSTEAQMRVPILAGTADWGTVEFRFRESVAAGAWGWLQHPMVTLAAFVAGATYLLYSVYLRKMLKHLDPSRVIPSRVRKTLDTLAEGLLVLDNNERILLANQSFAKNIGASVDELTGRKASDLPWESDADAIKIEGYPWQRAIKEDTPQTGELLTLRGGEERRRVLKVSAMPVFGDNGKRRGAMASFDDVTQIENSRVELRKMLDTLSASRDEIHRQNLELEVLASRDSLTGCLNRRAFFAGLETQWSTATRHDFPLACIMVDLDHFKAINDTHGHQAGDLVLQKASEMLRADRRPSDLVARYGGEEFCVVLPHTDMDAACIVAEQIRKAIEANEIHNIAVTASIGVSARSAGAANPQDLIDQADKSLYVAKRDGRNQVIRFDEAGDRIAMFEAVGESTTDSRGEASDAGFDELHDSAIPFHAVTALVSALAYRDPATADHSRRVADLCVATARRLMPVGQSYTLEIAALLHDIGKIGIPDSILLKQGKLTEEEWHMMNTHERIGAEIVQSTFSSTRLAEIIHSYRAWYGGSTQRPELPVGGDIPLAARILAIADAYDSMTTRQPYREPLSQDQAFAELRRCGNRQFDAELVEQFIDAVVGIDGGRMNTIADASKAAALSFGTQIERLAKALDDQDFGGIAALAHRLNLTAVKYDATEIAELASQLETASRGDSEVNDLVHCTNELLDLCRLTQRTYLNDSIRPTSDTGMPSRNVPRATGPAAPIANGTDQTTGVVDPINA